MSNQYLYAFTPGPRPELAVDPSAWTEADLAVSDAHVAHLKGAAADGVVLLAGRSQDGIGPAIVIFETDSDEAARSFMESDPFVAEGLFGATLHPYRVAFGPLAEGERNRT